MGFRKIIAAAMTAGIMLSFIPATSYADSTGLEKDYGFTPKIGIREGLGKFAEWYRDYYGI